LFPQFKNEVQNKPWRTNRHKPFNLSSDSSQTRRWAHIKRSPDEYDANRQSLLSMKIAKAKVSLYWVPVSCAMTAILCYLLFGRSAPNAYPPQGATTTPIDHQLSGSAESSLAWAPAASTSSNKPSQAAPASKVPSDDQVVDWDTAQAMMKRRDSTTFTNNGTFPSGVGRQMGLDDDQIMAVQTALGRFWKTMASTTAERARYDAEASDSALKKDVYRIPALADRGQALRDEFQKNLASIAGAENAASLVKGMSHEPFGDFGKYDVVVTFEPNTEFIAAGLGADCIRVSFEYTESSSGAIILSGTSTLEKFNELFGPWSRPLGAPESPENR
jgi:hypothetical protein